MRHARGLALSERGAELLGTAEQLDQHVQDLVRQATGLRQTPSGNVRITVNEPLGIHALMPAYAAITEKHPQLELEIVIDNGVQNLSRREADIAVRMFRPSQVDLVAKRVGAVEVGLFASPRYLERWGMPTGLEDLGRHIVIGMDRDGAFLRALQQWQLTPSDFRIRTDSIAAQIEGVMHGVGIGGLHLAYAARHPELVRVLPSFELGTLEVWLVMHDDARTSPAVRAVFEGLEQGLLDYLR